VEDPLAYLNGRFLPLEEAALPLHDAGFVMGTTATDLCRTFRKQLYRWKDHLARFRQSCQLSRIPQVVPDAELTAIAQQLISQNSDSVETDQEFALVVFATPGPIGYYAGLPGGPRVGKPTLGMHTFPLPFARYKPLFERGAHLIVPTTRHIPAVSLDPRAKMRSRLFWWLAEQETHDQEPGANALLLDLNDQITETAAANFLMVDDGVVVSPPRQTILGGISLHVVEGLCGQLAIPFEERPFTIDECLFADEAWLTSTPYCLAGVSQINGEEIPWPGPMLKRVQEAWNNAVGLDICRQILASR
jgi:branched-subunit amino acid aminotransferase/4-amino-4-deoxychorismate lyase